MILTNLTIQGVRNLADSTVRPAPRLNIVTGDNGAGKTSVLEAIHCLSVGHSFRSRKVRDIIHYDADALMLTADIRDPVSGETHRCGLQRTRGGDTQLRLDYQDVRSIAELTRLLPVKALTPDSHRLIQDGPAGRRQFIDWGVFHMEPGFLTAWRQFRRALQQRNQLLRDQAPEREIRSWDDALATAGIAIDRYRRSFVDALDSALDGTLQLLGADFPLTARYRSGWHAESSLADALETQFAQCRRFRTTTVGPHRADCALDTAGHPARDHLSRGQQKLLVYALHLAQLEIMRSHSPRLPIILCDDPAAELDAAHLSQVLTALSAHGSQVFLTGTDPAPLLTALGRAGDAYPADGDAEVIEDSRVAMFHMKRGSIGKKL